MKKITTLQKSLMVIGFIGWSLSGFAQAYKIDRNKVFFDREPIPHADARSFVDLGHGYAKDAFNVFYYGKKVDGASASTFKYTGDGYAQDAFNAYHRWRKLD